MNKSAINCMIITVSDTRTVATDKSGNLISDLLLMDGHRVVGHVIVRDEVGQIKAGINAAMNNYDVDVILMTGGTGIARRDVTIEIVEQFVEKSIPGFGEIFRMLSFTEDIGSKAILSRATAGICDSKVIFAMPGSTGAVKLAMEKLILPELHHVIAELNK